LPFDPAQGLEPVETAAIPSEPDLAEEESRLPPDRNPHP